MRYQLRSIFVFLLGLTACGADTVPTPSDAQAAGQDTAAKQETTLELVLDQVRSTMIVLSCTGAGSQFQAFDLAAAVDPDDPAGNYVGLTAFEMAEVADRSLSRNVLVTISLANASGTQRDLWTSDTIDGYRHEGYEVTITGSASGQRHRWNADGTQIFEAPTEIDNGEPRPFQITARCPQA